MIPNLQLRNLLNLQNNSSNPNPNLITSELLKDNLTEIQEKNILNFIFTLAFFMGSIVSVLSYFNYQNRAELVNINNEIENIIGVGMSKFQTKEQYENKISNLSTIKNIESNKKDFSAFYSDLTQVFNLLQNQTLVSLKYEFENKNKARFTLTVNSPRENLFNEIKSFTDQKTAIKNLTLINKLKLENLPDFQYEIKGEYERR